MAEFKKYPFDWHTDACERKNEHTENGKIHFFCVQHGQWAYEVPKSKVVQYTYDDGTVRTEKYNHEGLVEIIFGSEK